MPQFKTQTPCLLTLNVGQYMTHPLPATVPPVVTIDLAAVRDQALNGMNPWD